MAFPKVQFRAIQFYYTYYSFIQLVRNLCMVSDTVPNSYSFISYSKVIKTRNVKKCAKLTRIVN
jgi:hypothetical protein